MPVLPLLFIYASRRRPHRVKTLAKPSLTLFAITGETCRSLAVISLIYTLVMKPYQFPVRCAAQKPYSTLFLSIPLSNVISAVVPRISFQCFHQLCFPQTPLGMFSVKSHKSVLSSSLRFTILPLRVAQGAQNCQCFSRFSGKCKSQKANHPLNSYFPADNLLYSPFLL